MVCMGGIRICGTGRAVPEKLVTNQDLEQIVETSDEWITTRTGISTRHHIEGNETLQYFCVEAAKDALRQAGIDPKQIGVCIVATVTPDSTVPSQACRLQRDLKLPDNIPCFDLNAACSGFLFALQAAEGILAGSEYEYGLVLGAEALSRLIDWEDRSTCILFGDGAGAAVVRYRKGYHKVPFCIGCEGNDELLYVPGIGAEQVHIHMDGTKVFRFAVSTVPLCMEQVMKKAGVTMDEIDFFVFHQANARIIDLIVQKYEIPEEKYYKNLAEYGNTSAASIPLVLSELWDQGKIGSGKKAMVTGFGGGLTWGGALIEFDKLR